MKKISDKTGIKVFAFIYYAFGGKFIAVLILMLTSPQLRWASGIVIVLLFIGYYTSDTTRLLIRAWAAIVTRYTKNYEKALFTKNPSEGEGK